MSDGYVYRSPIERLQQAAAADAVTLHRYAQGEATWDEVMERASALHDARQVAESESVRRVRDAVSLTPAERAYLRDLVEVDGGDNAPLDINVAALMDTLAHGRCIVSPGEAD